MYDLFGIRALHFRGITKTREIGRRSVCGVNFLVKKTILADIRMSAYVFLPPNQLQLVIKIIIK